MNFQLLLSVIFLLIAKCQADITTTASASGSSSSAGASSSSSSASSVSPTLVWVTGTDSQGITRTTQSIFYQTFIKTYTANEETYSSGSIGVGSIDTDSISLGSFRSYEVTTVSSVAGAAHLKNGLQSVFYGQQDGHGDGMGRTLTMVLTCTMVSFISSLLFV
ncbi:uncharacterized protein LODBEIA_P15350 [Lodderomyces beijingensis]|uniref:Protein KRE1 n=1 Tax=Lodderomyces beijingensis TaxID=1775926 RepID=A0ABP0ZJJ6_9ASCO